MNKVRAYVKSVKSRGSLACAFLVRAWRKRLCRWDWHDDGASIWSDLILEREGQGASGCVVGDRIEWACVHCDRRLAYHRFHTLSARQEWIAHPSHRRVLPRNWSK